MTMLSKLNRILLGAAVVVGSAVALPGAARADADLALTLTSPTKASVLHYGDTISFKAKVVNTSVTNATGAKISAVTVPTGWELAGISGCTKVDKDQKSPVPCYLTSNGAATPGQIFGELDATKPQYAVAPVITLAAPAENPTPDMCPAADALETTTITIASDADANAANNSVTSPTFVIGPYQDLGIKLEAPPTAGYGDQFDVSVTVTNNGPCTAHNVLVDDEAGGTSTTMDFLGSVGACTDKTPFDTCELGDLAKGDIKTWTLSYKIGNYPSSLTSSQNPVALTVYADSDDYYDPNSSNDSGQTSTVARRSQSGCSTGELGGALSLLVLGVPFLRRRRKS